VIGYLHSLLGEFREAVTAYEKCLQIRPDYTLALANLGPAYLNIGKDAEAKDVLECIAKLGEGTMREQMVGASKSQNIDLNVRIAMGQVYQMLGAASLRLYLSQIQSETGKADLSLLSEAEASFTTALEYNPQDVHALYNLGNVNRLRNRWAVAARFYVRVLDLEPVNEEAEQNLHTIQEFREKQRRWLEAKVGRRAQESTDENPVYSEDLIDTVKEARDKLFEHVEVGHEEESFSQDDLLSSLLPVAQWLEEAGSSEMRIDLAARISKRGWLSEDRAAQLAGLETKTFHGAAQVSRTYDEILNFFAQGPSSQDVISFHPSPRAQERARYLLDRNETGELTAEEASELDQLGELEHLMQMVKARAQSHLGIQR
jgi:tetratricopeptide (TPR) repeat protein